MESSRRSRSGNGILDKSLSKGKQEVSLSAFALLFSEIIQYSQNRVKSVAELQTKLADFGYEIGSKLVDLLCLREKGGKREVKVLHVLMFVKITLWKSLFGKEADKLEQASDDDKIYYIIEKEPIISTFISVPKDKGSLNCAAFAAGIVEAVLTFANFPAKVGSRDNQPRHRINSNHRQVTAHWHKGTTLMIKFDESVITRERAT